MAPPSSEEVQARAHDPHDSSTLSVPYKLKAGLFLTLTGSFGLLLGFGGALAASKKSDPKSFDQGLLGPSSNLKPTSAQLHQSGAALATKALGYGTLIAISGSALLFYGIWKISGAKDLADFRAKAGRILPRIPKNDPPQSRTEFSGINDFLNYIIQLDQETKENAEKNGKDK